MKDLTKLKTYIIDSKDPHEVDDAFSLETEDNKNHNIKRNNEFKVKKKAKNRDTWIGRRSGQIDSELKIARALIQNKSNQDNYQLLMKESERINCLENEYLELLEEREEIRNKIYYKLCC